MYTNHDAIEKRRNMLVYSCLKLWINKNGHTKKFEQADGMPACLHHDERRSPTPWIQYVNTTSTTPILNITLLPNVTHYAGMPRGPPVAWGPLWGQLLAQQGATLMAQATQWDTSSNEPWRAVSHWGHRGHTGHMGGLLFLTQYGWLTHRTSLTHGV